MRPPSGLSRTGGQPDASSPTPSASPTTWLHSVESADAITVVVAGGLAGAFSCVIPLWGGGSGSRSVTKLID